MAVPLLLKCPNMHTDIERYALPTKMITAVAVLRISQHDKGQDDTTALSIIKAPKRLSCLWTRCELISSAEVFS